MSDYVKSLEQRVEELQETLTKEVVLNIWSHKLIKKLTPRWISGSDISNDSIVYEYRISNINAGIATVQYTSSEVTKWEVVFKNRGIGESCYGFSKPSEAKKFAEQEWRRFIEHE